MFIHILSTVLSDFHSFLIDFLNEESVRKHAAQKGISMEYEKDRTSESKIDKLVATIA